MCGTNLLAEELIVITINSPRHNFKGKISCLLLKWSLQSLSFNSQLNWKNQFVHCLNSIIKLERLSLTLLHGAPNVCSHLRFPPDKSIQKKVCALKAKNAPYHLSMILSRFCPCETLQICQTLMLPAWFWALLGFLKENMHCLKWCSLLWTPPWPTCSPLSCLLPTGLPAFGRARWAQRGSCAELCRAVPCRAVRACCHSMKMFHYIPGTIRQILFGSCFAPSCWACLS